MAHKLKSQEKKIEAGTILMNRCNYLDPTLPWTSVKDSEHCFKYFYRVKAYELKKYMWLKRYEKHG